MNRSGVTLVEILVALALGLILTSVAFRLTTSNRALVSTDQARTELRQDLEIGLTFIGDDLQIAGSGLGSPPNRAPIAYNDDGRLNIFWDQNISVNTFSYYHAHYRIIGTYLARWDSNDRTFKGVVPNVDTMSVVAVLNDGTRTENISRATWSTLRHVEVTLSGSKVGYRDPLTQSVTASFFPRNALSR